MSGINKHHEPDVDVARVMRRKSRRSFLMLGISATAGLAGWTWLTTRPEVGGLPYPLRRALEFNEKLAERYFTEARLAPTFPREMAREPRVNVPKACPPRSILLPGGCAYWEQANQDNSHWRTSSGCRASR